jgi:hypothetical protein
MTGEKKIIIDGVNVSKCGYYVNGECSIHGCGLSGEDTFCRECEANSNCYYKQLKRKEQKYTRLKADFESVKVTINVLQKFMSFCKN